MFSGWLCDASAEQLDDFMKKKPAVKRVNYFDKLISRCSYPPIAYFFDIGGFLCFPLFCRHFKVCYKLREDVYSYIHVLPDRFLFKLSNLNMI